MLKDEDIFRGIQSEIKKNPAMFKSSGQWLDDLLENTQGFIQPMSIAFKEASCEYPPDYRKIILIVWLLTDTYLHESELEITKYEKYVFNHEIIEPEDNGRERMISEQGLARDSVLCPNPEAMELVRNAWHHLIIDQKEKGVRDKQTGWTTKEGKKEILKYIQNKMKSDHSVIKAEAIRNAIRKFGLSVKLRRAIRTESDRQNKHKRS